jgi:hypothetical protein
MQRVVPHDWHETLEAFDDEFVSCAGLVADQVLNCWLMELDFVEEVETDEFEEEWCEGEM